MKIYLDSSELVFGQRLRNRIKEKGYTQDEFSELIGISKPTLVKYMNGKIDPPLSIFIKICDTLEVPYDYMLNGKIPLDICYRSVYGLLNTLDYVVSCNPENEDQILINYHGKEIFMEYEEIKEKTIDFLDFLLYRKSRE